MQFNGHLFLIDLLEEVAKNIPLNKNTARNLKIEIQYRAWISDGVRPKQAREMLAGTYFISEEAIKTILYSKAKTRTFDAGV